MKITSYVISFYLIVFVTLYFLTLNYNYVEGDDAQTILYHLCGRVEAIQRPYAAYNSGLDWLIQMTGLQDEQSLREFAVLTSFVSGFLLLCSLVVFMEVFAVSLPWTDKNSRFFLYFILPLIIPDLLFHSLIINSTNLAMALVIISLTVFVRFLQSGRILLLAISMLLFALAIPFRWTLLIALPIYTGLFLYHNYQNMQSRELWIKYGTVLLAKVSGCILAMFFIFVTGYDVNDVYQTIISTTGYLDAADRAMLAAVASASAMFTPAFILLMGIGCIEIFRQRNNYSAAMRLFYILFFSILPFFIVGFLPAYKFIISILPICVIIMTFGISFIFRRKKLLTGFVLIMVLPWILGIDVNASGTFCGPGFEMSTNKTYSYQDLSSSPDDRVKIHSFSVVPDGGFYMPTAEGPRPLYGYYYVLFAGGWKNEIERFTSERAQIVDFIIKNPGAQYFQDRATAFLSCDLYNVGYKTATGYIDNGSRTFRRFVRGGDTLTINLVPVQHSKSSWILGYMQKSDAPVIYRSSYTNDILRLSNDADSLSVWGPHTIVKP